MEGGCEFRGDSAPSWSLSIPVHMTGKLVMGAAGHRLWDPEMCPSRIEGCRFSVFEKHQECLRNIKKFCFFPFLFFFLCSLIDLLMKISN